jgi:hypothetical protein
MRYRKTLVVHCYATIATIAINGDGITNNSGTESRALVTTDAI